MLEKDLSTLKDLIAKIDEAKPHHHSHKIRCANRAIEILSEMIAKEARQANSLPRTAPGYMSWNEIAVALDLSKTAAFTRYGGKK